MSGLTSTGLEIETAESIKTSVDAQLRQDIAADLDTSAESVVGKLCSPIITRLASAWQALEAVYAARSRRNASFDSLDQLGSITGTARRAATKGRVVLSVTLNAGVTLAAGKVAQVAGQPDNRWVTTESVTNSGGSPATLSVQAEAQTAGRVIANASTITVIATPVAGWTAVTNALDATAGAPAEGDPAYRTRQEQQLSQSGTATIPAIRADLLALRTDEDTETIVSCSVDENTSAFPDSLGRPPHTFEAVVQFPSGLSGAALTAARQQVADQLWASKPAGIASYGTETGTTLDAEGVTRTVHWTEPTQILIYVTATISTDAAAYVGDAAVKTAIVAWSEALRLGDDVIRSRIVCVLDLELGITDAIEVLIGTTSGNQRAQNIAIGPRELAAFDTSRITITVQP